MFGRILALIIKEFHAIWRDKRSRTVLIIPPIIQLFLFSFAATLDVKNASIGILNRDNGEQSIELLQRFRGSSTFSHITYLASEKEVASFIDNQKGLLVISIDDQFSRDVDAKRPVDIQIIMDGRKSNSAQIVAGYISSIVTQFNRDLAKEKRIKQQRTVLVPRYWYNPNLIYYWFNVPS
jgi:ABC-2 type transport system permease protein